MLEGLECRPVGELCAEHEITPAQFLPDTTARRPPVWVALTPEPVCLLRPDRCKRGEFRLLPPCE